MQVYTGRYRQASKTQVTEVQDLSALEEGHLVAVFNEDKQSEPWIGRVKAVKQGQVDLVWYSGDYNKLWKPAKIPDPNNKQKRIEWEDTVPTNTILLYAFEFTSTGHLRKNTITHLKSRYQELRTED